MKVLIVSASDLEGGAAKAAYRLHRALLDAGVESRMLVQQKLSTDWTVIGPKTKAEKVFNLLRPYIDQIPVAFYPKRDKVLFSPSWLPFSSVIKRINEFSPDIVHLHWINGGMIRIEQLAKIKFPIVWTLHDTWAFTGGCHYTDICNKYQTGCKKCMVLNSKRHKDLSYKIFRRKKKTYKNMHNLTIVGLSKWLYNISKESKLLGNKKHINLPNPIDTTLYSPYDKILARNLWNLPEHKKIILFGAMSATSDLRKGYAQLVEALHKLRIKDVELVVFGSNRPKDVPDLGFKTHYVGRLYDDISLKILYSAADVTVVPSFHEAFGLVVIESMACGTPVVAFDATGPKDIISHKIDGYLARPYDTDDLARGIEWILNNSNYQDLAKNAREKVVKNFDSKIVAQKYIQLYEKILRDR